MEEDYEIEEEYNRFPGWIWLAILVALIWAFLFAPFSMLNP